MITDTKAEKANFFNLFACKCPRCRKGDMFVDRNPWHLRRTMKMHDRCPLCNQPLNLEPGFYFGSSYVSYAITVALSAATCIIWWQTIGFPSEISLLLWMVSNAVLMLIIQPYLMRLSRTGWLAFFVRFDPFWKINPPKEVERTNKDQENNW